MGEKYDRVYCQECYWHGMHNEEWRPEGKLEDIVGVHHCDHPENILERTRWGGDWFAPSVTKDAVYKRSPHEINKNNDCPWFRKKGPVYAWEFKKVSIQQN